MDKTIVLRDERYAVIGAAFEVHRILGVGFTEYVYQDALEQEFQIRGIPYEREKHLTIAYKGKILSHEYQADFICFGSIVVECKAANAVLPVHEAQTLNYMRASKLPVGILLNFGETSLYKKVFVIDKYLR